MSEPKNKSSTVRDAIVFTLALVGGIVVLVFLLAAFFIPNFVGGIHGSPQITCINNLRQIAGAKHSWALENRQDSNAIPTSADVAQFLKNNRLPVCPNGGKYSIGRVGEDPTCSVPQHRLPTP